MKFTELLQKAPYSLSRDEHERLTRAVRAHMRARPHAADAPNRWLSGILFVARPLSFALVMTLVFGGTISVAAESALPGDALYAIKTKVNEPARLAIATTPAARAEVAIELAERRIQEAAALAAEERLDDAAQIALSDNLESQARIAEEAIETERHTDRTSARLLAARLDVRRVAHARILEEIRPTRADAAPPTAFIATASGAEHEETVVMTMTLAAPSETIETASPADATTMTDDTLDADVRRSAMTTSAPALTPEPLDAEEETEEETEEMREAADDSIRDAEKRLKKARHLSADLRAEIEAKLIAAHEQFSFGKSGTGEDSRGAFESAIRLAEETMLLIKTAPNVEKAKKKHQKDHD